MATVRYFGRFSKTSLVSAVTAPIASSNIALATQQATKGRSFPVLNIAKIVVGKPVSFHEQPLSTPASEHAQTAVLALPMLDMSTRC